MPDSIFSGFVVLDSFQNTDAGVRLRFVPQFFEAGDIDPVLAMDIRSPTEAGEVAGKIARIQQGCITDVRVDPHTLEVWLENKGQQVTFRGWVTWSSEAYTLADYLRAVAERDQAADKLLAHIRHLRATIDRAVGFIDRAIDRAERKEGAGKLSNGRAAQEVQLLRSVRRQLTDH